VALSLSRGGHGLLIGYLGHHIGITSKSNEAIAAHGSVVHPRRITVAQRLQTNATLKPFEELDLSPKSPVPVRCSRGIIGDHVKADHVLAVIYTPELEKELAEPRPSSLPKQSFAGARRAATWTTTSNITLQDALLILREERSAGHWIHDHGCSMRSCHAEIARRISALLKRNLSLSARLIDLAAAPWRRPKPCSPIRPCVAPFDGVLRDAVNARFMSEAASASG